MNVGELEGDLGDLLVALEDSRANVEDGRLHRRAVDALLSITYQVTINITYLYICRF